jgi:putative endonuclease
MPDHISLGQWGEKQAAAFLKKAGYKILKMNFRCPLGEIDIIAREKKTLVFVEVKTRTSEDFAKPVEAITPHKMRRICNIARYYLKQPGLKDTDCRMDVVSVEPHSGGKADIKLIKDAFQC